MRLTIHVTISRIAVNYQGTHHHTPINITANRFADNEQYF